MKKNYILLLTLLITGFSYGQIFITELADPSDETTCRYVELYNAGATAVDLGIEGYKIQRYTNGNASPQTAVALTGTIDAGGFFIIGRSGFNGCYGFTPDMSLNSGLASDSNGDDQIQILDGTDAVIDIFGVPGEDGTGTCHDFLDGRAERIASVTTGNTGTWNEANWNVTGDGSPTGCTSYTSGTIEIADGVFDPGAWIGALVTDTTVSFSNITSTTTEGIGTVDVCVSITNPDVTNATTVDITLNVLSTATNGDDFAMITFPQTLTFPANTSADQCLTFTITDDVDVELEEDIVLNLENVGGGSSAVLGTTTTHTMTISANDLDVPNVGDIIITEIMQNPAAVSDANGEWFEVHNITGADIDMHGWSLIDTNSTTILNNSVGTTIVPAGGYLLLAAEVSSAVNGGMTNVDYNLDGTGVGLPNGVGSLVFEVEGVEIDRVDWTDSGDFPVPNGASMELSLNSYDSVSNDDGNNWGLATTTFGDGDLGTPGLVNVLSVGINEIDGFAVYPNPINDGFFSLNSFNRMNKSIQIYNLLGKQVLNLTVENRELVDVSNLNSGLYIIKVEEEGKMSTRKLIIE